MPHASIVWFSLKCFPWLIKYTHAKPTHLENNCSLSICLIVHEDVSYRSYICMYNDSMLNNINNNKYYVIHLHIWVCSLRSCFNDWLIDWLHVCVYEVCVRMHVCTCRYVCMQVRGWVRKPEVDRSIFPDHSQVHFQGKVSGKLTESASLARQGGPRIICMHLPMCWDHRQPPHTPPWPFSESCRSVLWPSYLSRKHSIH